MKKNTLITNTIVLFITALVTGVLSFFNIFQKLDYRLYDFLLHFKKEIPIEKDIVLVKIVLCNCFVMKQYIFCI